MYDQFFLYITSPATPKPQTFGGGGVATCGAGVHMLSAALPAAWLGVHERVLLGVPPTALAVDWQLVGSWLAVGWQLVGSWQLAFSNFGLLLLGV